MIADDSHFASAVASILRDPVRHAEMREAARAFALSASWDSVFEGVYEAYSTITMDQPAALPIRVAL
jgi:phosphatidylinositol alpha 1,6-mannosyltransferase